MPIDPKNLFDFGAGATSRSVQRVSNLPSSIRQVFTGEPVEIDGMVLDQECQLALRAAEWTRPDALTPANVAEFRLFGNSSAIMGGGAPFPLPEVREFSIMTNTGPIEARLYRPVPGDTTTPGLLYLHGGSWTFGNLDTHQNVCRLIASTAKVTVLAIHYSLSPERVFPFALNEVRDAWDWMHDRRPELGIEGPIAIGGDSAGANMATVHSIRCRDEGWAMPAFQLLFVPATDMVNMSYSRERFKEGFFLTEADLEEAAENYLGGDESLLANPYVSPIMNTDLSGLPMAHIATAGFDPLRDQGEAYGQALRKAGVVVDICRHPTLVHPFANMIGVSQAARHAVVLAAGALRMGMTHVNTYV